MLIREEAERILQSADLICPAEVIEKTIQRLADEITLQLSGQYPLVLCVMSGSAVFAGHLLPKLVFPLNFDYLQISRYRNTTSGGEVSWQRFPQHDVLQDRVVLVIDDILDEGVTLVEIRRKILSCGAKSFHSVVLVDKQIDIAKPIAADFVGLELPNRYLFGFGMDIYGAWRNLPAIYAKCDNV